MKSYMKALYIASWIPVVLLHTFPLVMLWPFFDLSVWQAFLPIGLMPLGLVMVPFALSRDSWPKYLWLWCNDEEGCPDWWLNVADGKGGFIGKFPRFWWYAVRNPVNNFRFIFKDRTAELDTNWFDPKPMEAANLLEAGQAMAYRWAYAGPFAGYRQVWLNSSDKYSEFWIGWKVSSIVSGLGFTFQYRRKRQIGQ